MKIAVTSQNFKTVTNHAGKARRFIVFDAQKGSEPVEVERLKLPKEQALHNCKEGEPHPIDIADVLISASFGAGFTRKMDKRGIAASLSDKEDPIDAVKQYLKEGARLPEDGCGDASEHKHEHSDSHSCGCDCSS